MSAGVTFRKIRGRIIPFRTSRQIGAGSQKLVASKLIKKNREKVEPHKGYQAAALGLNIAGGVIAGATAFSSPLVFSSAFAASTGLDILSASANVTSFAGKNNLRSRAKGALEKEAFNNAVGYSAFIGTMLGTSKGRTKLFRYAVTAPRKIGRLPSQITSAVKAAPMAAAKIGKYGAKFARVYGKIALKYGVKLL